jgi:hypothetical protein
MTFTCPKCKRDNLLSDEVCFSYGTKVRYCKICRNKHQNTRRENMDRSKESIRQKDYHILKTYGLTRDEYNKKLELQSRGCAVCKQTCPTGKNLAVDHNHKTNVLRDLLCIRCNNILGLANDNELLLWKLLEYLKRHDSKVA